MKKAYPGLRRLSSNTKILEGAVPIARKSYKRLSHCYYYTIGMQEKTKHREWKGALFFIVFYCFLLLFLLQETMGAGQCSAHVSAGKQREALFCPLNRGKSREAG